MPDNTSRKSARDLELDDETKRCEWPRKGGSADVDYWLKDDLIAFAKEHDIDNVFKSDGYMEICTKIRRHLRKEQTKAGSSGTKEAVSGAPSSVRDFTEADFTNYGEQVQKELKKWTNGAKDAKRFVERANKKPLKERQDIQVWLQQQRPKTTSAPLEFPSKSSFDQPFFLGELKQTNEENSNVLSNWYQKQLVEYENKMQKSLGENQELKNKIKDLEKRIASGMTDTEVATQMDRLIQEKQDLEKKVQEEKTKHEEVIAYGQTQVREAQQQYQQEKTKSEKLEKDLNRLKQSQEQLQQNHEILRKSNEQTGAAYNKEKDENKHLKQQLAELRSKQAGTPTTQTESEEAKQLRQQIANVSAQTALLEKNLQQTSTQTPLFLPNVTQTESEEAKRLRQQIANVSAQTALLEKQLQQPTQQQLKPTGTFVNPTKIEEDFQKAAQFLEKQN